MPSRPLQARLAEIAQLADRIKAGECSARLTPDGSHEPLDRLITALNIIAEKLEQAKQWRESTEARLAAVVDAIVAVASLDFSRRAEVGERGDTLDALATGLNMLQEELQHTMVSRSYLDSIMRSMVDVLVVADTTGRIQNANPAALALLGYGIDELRERQLSTLWAEPSAAPQVPDIVARGGPITVEASLRRRDGGAVPVHCSLSLIRDDSGVASGIVCAARDMTERRRADEALKAAKEAAEELAAQAQAASRAKGEFISVVSHEIRTPLTAIVGMTQALEMSGLSKEQEELVGVMREAEDMLMSLLNSVLDLSRAETGRVVLEDLDFDPRSVVRQRAELLAGQARQHGTEVRWAVDDGVPALLRGDPGRLGQVLTNLLGNAVKFTEGGRIEVNARIEQQAAPTVLLFEVADTGIGIPADRVQAVFEPFMQADASTTRKYGGTGLGLAICRRLVELMGGRIWVESEQGKGSRFCFTARFTHAQRAADAAPAG